MRLSLPLASSGSEPSKGRQKSGVRIQQLAVLIKILDSVFCILYSKLKYLKFETVKKINMKHETAMKNNQPEWELDETGT